MRKMKEGILSVGYFDRARGRAKRRKSAWNLLLIPLAFIGIGSSTYVLFKLMWFIHTWIYPEHLGRLDEFWGEGISFRAFVSSMLLAMPLFFASIPTGMIISNIVAWCILPARKAFDREAMGVKWGTFREATKGIVQVAIIIVPFCLLLSFICAATLKNLQ